MTFKEFESWMNSFESEGDLYIKHIKHMQAGIERYTGTLKKEMKLYVRDFEEVVSQEV